MFFPILNGLILIVYSFTCFFKLFFSYAIISISIPFQTSFQASVCVANAGLFSIEGRVLIWDYESMFLPHLFKTLWQLVHSCSATAERCHVWIYSSGLTYANAFVCVCVCKVLSVLICRFKYPCCQTHSGAVVVFVWRGDMVMRDDQCTDPLIQMSWQNHRAPVHICIYLYVCRNTHYVLSVCVCVFLQEKINNTNLLNDYTRIEYILRIQPKVTIRVHKK